MIRSISGKKIHLNWNADGIEETGMLQLVETENIAISHALCEIVNVAASKNYYLVIEEIIRQNPASITNLLWSDINTLNSNSVVGLSNGMKENNYVIFSKQVNTVFFKDIFVKDLLSSIK